MRKKALLSTLTAVGMAAVLAASGAGVGAGAGLAVFGAGRSIDGGTGSAEPHAWRKRFAIAL